jgi:hypothetical protein
MLGETNFVVVSVEIFSAVVSPTTVAGKYDLSSGIV